MGSACWEKTGVKCLKIASFLDLCTLGRGEYTSEKIRSLSSKTLNKNKHYRSLNIFQHKKYYRANRNNMRNKGEKKTTIHLAEILDIINTACSSYCVQTSALYEVA